MSKKEKKSKKSESPIIEKFDLKIHCKYDELANPNTLNVHPDNPNDHSETQIEHLAWLYQRHGFRHPIIISKQTGFIIAGHGRRLAAIKAGIEFVPVVYQDFKDAQEEYEFIVADNGIAAQAELDQAKIREKIVEFGPDFDVKSLGLADFEIETNTEPDFPSLNSGDPDVQARTFILSNEQVDFLNTALAKAKKELDCTDEINQNQNGNILAAILKNYVYG